MGQIRGEQISGSVASASYALTASYATNAGTTIDTGSFVTTSSFGQFTSSIQQQVGNLTAATASYVLASQTSSMSVLSSSFATTASYYQENDPAFTAVSGTFITTASFNAFTASYNTASFSGSFTGSLLGTSSWAHNALTASYYIETDPIFVAKSASFATTGSNTFTGNQTINGNVSINGTASISYLNVAYESASVIYSSGSNQFGDASNDTQTLWGTVDVKTGPLLVSGSIYIPDNTNGIYFSGSAAPSKLTWNDTDGTLDLGLKGGNVTLQIGQEEVVRVVNKTGADLLESQYRVVRVRSVAEGGAQGQRLAIVLAQANNDANSATTIGIVTENITNNEEGFITTFGLVRGINTTGTLQGETWVDGDMIYLSPTTPGAITNIKPQGPNHSVVLGYVVYAHNNQGKIFVKVDNGYEIDELHNVHIETGSLSSGNLLVRSGSVWTNTNQLTGSYGLTGSLTATSFTGSLLGTASYASAAQTASYVLNAVSASYATQALSASFASTANTASYVLNAVSSSFATTSSVSLRPVNTTGSTLYSTTPSTGNVSATNGLFLGSSAGSGATNANFSVFLGYLAGQSATNANESIFVGPLAGGEAANAPGTIALGSGAGYRATSASYSTLIGYYVGSNTDASTSIGSGNIIIGNNITLPAGTKNSINLGAIIFATGSYSTLGAGNLYSGSQAGIGRVGINKVTPIYTLDVSGSGNYSNGLTVTGSLIAATITGSLLGTASYATQALSASYAPTIIPSGAFGIANSSGSYTYYTTFSASIAAATSGQTVEMFADIVETGSITVTLKNGVNINGNGHTYALDTSTTTTAFIDGGTAVTMQFNNITLVRKGAGAGIVIGLSVIGNRIVGNSTFIRVESNSSLGITNYGGAVFSGYVNGFTVTCTGTSCKGISLIRGYVDDCNVISTGNAIEIIIGTITNCYGESTGAGDGINISNSGYASNCNGKSNTGYGIYNGVPVYNSTGYSAGNIGIYFAAGALYNCVGASAANNGIFGFGEIASNCTAMSSAATALFIQNAQANTCTAYSTVSSALNLYNSSTAHNSTLRTLSSATAVATSNSSTYASLKNCTIINDWNNSGGHGVPANSILTVINCAIKVANASANCLSAATPITMKYANNVFEGATIAVNSNITQGMINTHDNFGNIII